MRHDESKITTPKIWWPDGLQYVSQKRDTEVIKADRALVQMLGWSIFTFRQPFGRYSTPRWGDSSPGTGEASAFPIRSMRRLLSFLGAPLDRQRHQRAAVAPGWPPPVISPLSPATSSCRSSKLLIRYSNSPSPPCGSRLIIA